MLYKHLLLDFRRGSGQANRGKGLDGFTVLAILNCQLFPPGVTAPLRGWGRRLCASGKRLPLSHGLRPESNQIPSQPPLDAGPHQPQDLSPAQAMSRTLDHLERLAVSSTTDERQTLSILA